MSTKEAIEVLKNAMDEDPDYRRAWVDNISMSFQDEFKRDFHENGAESTTGIKGVADKAADHFLNILFINHN